MAKLMLAGLAAALCYFLVPFSPRATTGSPPAETVNGTWIGEFRTHAWRGVAESLWLSIKVQTPDEKYGFSFHVPLKDLEGMSIGPGHRGEARVRFSLPREAGRFDFEGTFREDTGSGDFQFAPNPDYVHKMESLGYRRLPLDQLFVLAIHDVTTEFVEALRALGYSDVPVDQLGAMKIHGATPDFIRALQDLGYAGLPVDQLVAMRIHGVSLDYIRDIHAAGYRPSADKLVEMRIHGVSADFVRSMKEDSR